MKVKFKKITKREKDNPLLLAYGIMTLVVLVATMTGDYITGSNKGEAFRVVMMIMISLLAITAGNGKKEVYWGKSMNVTTGNPTTDGIISAIIVIIMALYMYPKIDKKAKEIEEKWKEGTKRKQGKKE